MLSIFRSHQMFLFKISSKMSFENLAACTQSGPRSKAEGGEVGNSRASIPHQSLRVLCARKQFKSIFHNIQHQDAWITKALTTRVKLMIERGRWGEEGSTLVRNFRVATRPKGSLPLPEAVWKHLDSEQGRGSLFLFICFIAYRLCKPLR